jgi:hypothetical protein
MIDEDPLSRCYCRPYDTRKRPPRDDPFCLLSAYLSRPVGYELYNALLGATMFEYGCRDLLCRLNIHSLVYGLRTI